MSGPRCLRRRQLYQRQLDEVQTDFGRLAKLYPRLASALGDPDLVFALEASLEPYVVYGVARDLERLRRTRGLLRRIDGDAPAPPLDVLLPPRAPAAQAALPADERDAAITSADAYKRYFEWCIEPTDVGGSATPRTGVSAFYARYPLLEHAVRTVAENHRGNVQLVCERVMRDWTAIRATFFPGREIERLVKIRTTGSDSHKGGKQVLILTFETAEGRTGRVVYKPSPVELDCRIVGDSDTVNYIAPKGPHDSEPYRQDASLTEVINRRLPPRRRPEGFTSRELPTYRILPFNRGSVSEAYGYIEFLSHEPEVQVTAATAERIPDDIGAAIGRLTPDQVKGSDWIAQAGSDGEVFYHQYGALMAMAMAVSMSDLHVQNVITHDRRPHLIDLEDSLKRPMTGVATTGLPGTVDAHADPVGLEIRIFDEQTDKLSVGFFQATPRPATGTLYRRSARSEGGRRLSLTDAPRSTEGGWDNAPSRHRRALVRGFIDVVEGLADRTVNAEVKAWIRALDGTLARFVPVATRQYAEQARTLFWTYCENDPRALDRDDGYAEFSYTTPMGLQAQYFLAAARTRRDDYAAKLQGPGSAETWALPFFALEHKDHAWFDYLNCDVPSFYHRLGSRDLLNSRGEVVDVVAATAWQDEHLRPPPLPSGWSATHSAHYLPETAVAMAGGQLDRIARECATSSGTRAFVRRALADLGAIGEVQGIAERVLRFAAAGQAA